MTGITTLHIAHGATSTDNDGEVWVAVRGQACSLALREPMLRPLLENDVAGAADGAEVLARAIVGRLSPRLVEFEELLEIFIVAFRSDPALLRASETDLIVIPQRDPACPDFLHALMNLKGFHALQTYRIAHWLWTQDRRALALWLSNLSSLFFGPDIHPAANIGAGVMLDHGSGIVIGETATVGEDVSILQNVTLGGTGKQAGDRHPKVGQGVMLGAGAKILGNIEIGAFSRIAAGSVVLKPVPAHCTVAGVPARIVRMNLPTDVPSETMDQTL